MKNLFETLQNKKIELEGCRNESLPKVEYEFQDLALEMTECFGETYRKQIWPLFYRSQYTISMIRDSFIAYKKQPIESFRYFMGILNNKTKKHA